jgi:hypothetical protein
LPYALFIELVVIEFVATFVPSLVFGYFLARRMEARRVIVLLAILLLIPSLFIITWPFAGVYVARTYRPFGWIAILIVLISMGMEIGCLAGFLKSLYQRKVGKMKR